MLRPRIADSRNGEVRMRQGKLVSAQKGASCTDRPIKLYHGLRRKCASGSCIRHGMGQLATQI